MTRCGSAGIRARSQSQAVVTVVTARLGGIWHKRCIMSVGEQSLILEASDLLKICLAEIGKKEHLSAADILFCEDGDNAGVFLVVGGTVRMSVKGHPGWIGCLAAGRCWGCHPALPGGLTL